MIYIGIFISKILENTLSTLRIIVVSNGKKKLGAILQGLVALIWIFVTGVVIIDINEDIAKITFFVIGSIAGSYLGSLLEEKIALGTNLVIIKSNKLDELKYVFRNYNIIIKDNYLLFISQRKNTKDIVNKTSSIDNTSKIILEKIKIVK
jgi:uncharacterized protein YebE (UPF0316 family)